MAPTISVPEFSHFVPEISDRLQRIADTYLESYNEHHAFVHLVAELYETTSGDRFVFSDGPKDGGIDFFVKDPPSYTVCQCKCPDLDLLQYQPSIPKFDQSALRDLTSAIDMLRDRSGEYDVKSEIKRLRGDYQRDLTTDRESTHLTAILAVLGELTDPARTAFRSIRSSRAEEDVHLKLVEWKDVYQSLHALDSPADIDFDIDIHFDDENDLLAHRDYCYLLAHAFDFYQAFRQHEWNLFEWNVRYQLHNSLINRRIVATLSRHRGRKSFHHYNNGLLITCKRYRIDRAGGRLKLFGPQIINGCQTVRAICEAYDSLTPAEQQHLREVARVQVKVIKTTEPDFIGGLVISTNDQNPMKPRNLKSNTSEQRDMQRAFRELPKKSFYERKDGEFKSLCAASSRVRWFRKSDYAVGRRRFRVVDNQELAKAWYAFTGHSNRALRGGIDYFDDEPEGVYNRVFKSVPSPAFWSAFREISFQLKDEYFEPGLPSVYQYLLAFGTAKYVDSRRISFRINRTEAIKRGIGTGVLRGDPESGRCTSTPREVDEYLSSSDLDYRLNIMINNMREVLIELISFVLCRKYTACDAISSQRLVTMLPHEAAYFDGGFFEGDLLPVKQDGVSLLGPTYEFLRDCVKQYYFEFEAEINAAPRLKSYLAQRSTVNRLRDLLIRRNNSIRDYDAPWKELGRTFIESLPEIPGT